MSSLGEFLNAMVELRRNKAQVEEYNANQRIAGMEDLGKGFGGLLGGLGKGLQTQQQDALANRMVNMEEPPRAQAVNPALQGAADTTVRPGQIPYDVLPMTQGGPFTGGKAGFDMRKVLDTQALNQFKADTARQGMIDRNIWAGNRALDASDRLEETVRHHKEIEDARAQAEKNDLASAAMKQADEGYQKKVKAANAYNTGITAALGQMAGAKTQSEYEKAATVLTGLYQAHTASGFKDLPFPKMPPSPEQKTAAATAATDASGQDTWHIWNPGSWGNPSPAAIEARKQAAQNMPGAWQYPGPAAYEMATPPEDAPSHNPQDYMQGGSAAPSGPSGQQGGGGYSSPADVKAAFQAGKLSQEQARGILKSQFGFE
jgi:hypothetical protein